MRILKKGLKITFINLNTEEQIVQAMAGVLAYNLAENDNKIIFDYNSDLYSVTKYQKEGVAANVNSDVITTQIEQNGKIRNGCRFL